MTRRTALVIVLLAVGAVAGGAWSAFGGATRPENHYVGSKRCFECHVGLAREWAQLDHSKILLRAGRPAARAGCEACHGPGYRHSTQRAWRHEIVSWKNVPPAQQSARCLRCHEGKVTPAGWKGSPHSKLGSSCLLCHEVHRATGTPGNLQKAQANLCGDCHSEIADMAKTGKHHALPRGLVCTNCHDPHSAARPKLLRADKRELCHKCHAPNGPRVRPSSHGDEKWATSHGKTAKAGMARCDVCHSREEFCNACHGLTMPHPDDWSEKHGASAIKSPEVCANCHDQKKCVTCHAEMPPSFHKKEGFRKRVAEEAKGHEALCKLCHTIPIPHPENWVETHKGKGASFAEDSPCWQCHKKAEFCVQCHPDK